MRNPEPTFNDWTCACLSWIAALTYAFFNWVDTVLGNDAQMGLFLAPIVIGTLALMITGAVCTVLLIKRDLTLALLSLLGNGVCAVLFFTFSLV